ncbi:MAG: NUDIX domain-containing protein [Candidatus Shapirobacteria bacterium]|jgi:isopentenyldiphosphate isomerase
MDELLDLVNEKDEVIGEVWRSQTQNNQNIIFREVGVLIYDNQKRLLLQRRSFNKKTYPGYWIISAGGHVGKGKNPDEVAHSELSEELGFDTELKFEFKILMTYPTNRSIAYGYSGEYNKGKITIQEEEVEEARFFSEEEFEELVKSDKVEPTSAKWCRNFWKNNSTKLS